MGEIAKKLQERRLNWYGHVMRRGDHYVERRAMEMKVQGVLCYVQMLIIFESCFNTVLILFFNLF